MIWEDTALFFIYKIIKFRRHTIYFSKSNAMKKQNFHRVRNLQID